MNEKLQQGSCGLKDLAIHADNDICEGLSFNDLGLDFEPLQSQNKCQIEDAGTSCLMTENLSVTESTTPIENNAVEVGY